VDKIIYNTIYTMKRFTTTRRTMSSTPDVRGVPALRFHALQVSLGFGTRFAAFRHNRLDYDLLYLSRHISGVTAHVDVSLFVANYIPDLFHVILQEMGHVYLVVLVPGEGGVQFGERPVGHPFGELLLVEVVFGLLSAAEVQYGIAYGFVALPHMPALLNEAPEWRQTSARTYHYDGRLRFGRQSELRATYENRNQNFVAVITPRELSLQPIGGHSLIHAISARLILDHNGRHVNRIGM